MAFGWKKPQKQPTDYYDIGRNGTYAEFEAAFATLKTKANPRDKVDLLLDGITDAFVQGRTEQLQAVLSARENFSYEYFHRLTTKQGEGSLETWKKVFKHSHYPSVKNIDITQHLFNLSEKTENPEAAIRQALEKVSATETQRALNAALYEGLDKGEKFLGAVLDCGANPNAAACGKKAGCITAYAVRQDLPVSTLKLLQDHGANFRSARAYMTDEKWGESYLDRLESYHEKITGAPPGNAPENTFTAEDRALFLQMAETILELTQRVETLEQASRKKPAARTATRKNNPQS